MWGSKNENRCWVKFKDNTVGDLDFIDNVDSWKRINQVNLCGNFLDKVTVKEIRRKEKYMKDKGIRVMCYTKNNLGVLEDD